MWKREMVERLRSAANGEKDRIISEYSNLTGKTPATLYRIARKNGYETGRRTRRDAGRCVLNEQQLTAICGLMSTTAREVKGVIMPVEEALQIAEDNGIVEPGACSASWLAKLLRDHNMNRAALDTPAPSIRMRSLHPNHVHVVDASVCIQFYLQGRLRMMREDKFYKNKWQNFARVKKKLLRYILVDHCSHCIFVKYYYTGGETQANFFDFLCSAWQGSKHAKFPFRGVPFFLLMDAGAANISKAVLAWLEQLDIEIPKSLPNNPRRQGAAEVAQNIVESRFESKLRIQPAHSIEDLNEWALDWAVHFNASHKHRRHGMSRTQCWLTIRAEQLRELPDRQILQDLFAEPQVQRKVNGDYTVSFRSQAFDVRHIPGITPNYSNVDVILRPYHWPEVGVVFNGTEYLVSPLETDDYGFRADGAITGQQYKAMPETDTQQHKKRAENLAYGEDHAKDAAPFEGLTVYGNRAEKVKQHFIPRTGQPLQVAPDAIAQHIPVIVFLKKLRAEIGDIPAEINLAVRQAHGTTINRAESQRLLDIARDTGTLTPADIQEDGHAPTQAAAV